VASDPIRPEGSAWTGDLELVQALAATRGAAATNAARAEADGADDAGRWRRLSERVDALLDRFGVEGREPGHPPAIGFGRIDRSAIDLSPEATDRLASSLRALADRPDAERLAAAERALDDVEDALG
jgi:hypothetical protein